MYTAEVIPSEVQSQGCFQVRPLFREGVRQARQSAKLHPHGEILPLNVRRANPVFVRVAHDGCWDRSDNVSRGVPRFAVAGSRVNLDQLGIVATVNERVVNRSRIGLKAVRRNLESPIRCRVSQFPNEGSGRGLVPSPKMESQHQFTVSLNRNEGVSIAQVFPVNLIHPFVLFFLPDVAPNLIALNIRDGHVTNTVDHELFALLASYGQERKNCSVVNVGEPRCAIDGAAFQKKVEHLSRFIERRIHTAQLIIGFRERLATLAALETLRSLAILPAFLAEGVAIVTCQSEPCLSLAIGSQWRFEGPSEQSLGFGPAECYQHPAGLLFNSSFLISVCIWALPNGGKRLQPLPFFKLFLP